MHIEPGYISQAKLAFANTSALGVLAFYARDLIAHPTNILRTLLAAVFFSLFMQSFHMSVGPSELHFVGAMAIYLTLGFIPTLFGFALGLLLQGMLFEPTDLVHLAVNSLSLILPLVTVHYTIGRKLSDALNSRRVNWLNIVKLDALYYAGVTTMVGFWLLVGEVATPFTAWATFASSYLVLVAVEPLFTYSLVKLLKRHEGKPLVDTCFAVKSLKLAD
ncbi:MAG: energy-coupling factor ABC transporter permease [Sulfuricellaceae bacterium]